eukprot:SAG11_NODE_2228_length_3654_cov_1.962640_1_plen_58_part_00
MLRSHSAVPYLLVGTVCMGTACKGRCPRFFSKIYILGPTVVLVLKMFFDNSIKLSEL